MAELPGRYLMKKYFFFLLFLTSFIFVLTSSTLCADPGKSAVEARLYSHIDGAKAKVVFVPEKFKLMIKMKNFPVGLYDVYFDEELKFQIQVELDDDESDETKGKLKEENIDFDPRGMSILIKLEDSVVAEGFLFIRKIEKDDDQNDEKNEEDLRIAAKLTNTGLVSNALDAFGKAIYKAHAEGEAKFVVKAMLLPAGTYALLVDGEVKDTKVFDGSMLESLDGSHEDEHEDNPEDDHGDDPEDEHGDDPGDHEDDGHELEFSFENKSGDDDDDKPLDFDPRDKDISIQLVEAGLNVLMTHFPLEWQEDDEDEVEKIKVHLKKINESCTGVVEAAWRENGFKLELEDFQDMHEHYHLLVDGNEVALILVHEGEGELKIKNPNFQVRGKLIQIVDHNEQVCFEVAFP